MTREETIEVVLRNIRRGRTYRQEAGFIVDALLAFGFRYVAPDEVVVPERPTEAMLREGEGYTDLVMPDGFPNTVEERRMEIACAWAAMIDAALGRGTADRIRARKRERANG